MQFAYIKMLDSFLVSAQVIHVLIRLYMCADQLVHAQMEKKIH